MHFWLATIGIVLYIASMWVSGIMQGLMWRTYDDMGFLKYSFVETVAAMHPMYVTRALGGIFFLSGAIVMIYNFYKTIKTTEVKLNDKEILNQAKIQMLNHEKIETNSILLLVLTILVISIGGIVEIVPLFKKETEINEVNNIRPYTP